MNTIIIGISGVSGAGKSTLAEALQKELGATLIAWDDFDATSTGPNDYVEWYNRGQDYAEWDYPQLKLALQKLKSDTKYTLFDAPLGRFHEQTGKYIDCWVHVSVPLDVSLARRVIRDYKKETLLDDLKEYLQSSRPLFFDDDYKEKADLVIDGTDPLESQVLKVKNQLLLKNSDSSSP